jgi:pyridoxine 4-dehydrogenase
MSNTTNETFVANHLLGGRDRVPRLGYGAMQLAGPRVIGLPEDVAGAIAVLRSAVDQGVRFFDTANAYGPRTVNQIIGRALSPFADDVVIGNKVGAWRDPAGGWTLDQRPETLRTQVEDALLDTRTEVSLLTYLRLPGDNQGAAKDAPTYDVPLEEALGTLVQLRDEGKIRHIGLATRSAGRAEIRQAGRLWMLDRTRSVRRSLFWRTDATGLSTQTSLLRDADAEAVHKQRHHPPGFPKIAGRSGRA